jgi:flagellar motor component MotA
MKELYLKNRDTILVVLLVCFLGGVLFEGGRFLLSIIKWPVILAVIVGVVFGIGNDGYHALKRTIRDRAWPWVKAQYNNLLQ